MSADPRPPAVELVGVTRRFPVGLGLRRREVLHDVDLRVERAATLGLVGPNGSGKSTLLRLIAGIDRASAGRVAVFGESPLASGVRARLSYLPEESPFPGELTGLSVMALLGSLAGLPRKQTRARAERLLERVGLARYARTRLRSYSRGMTRRFGLAQVFLSDPELILLDEPTAGLDATGFGVLEELVGEARSRGATTVLASHLLSDVHAHCDRLAILIAGRVVAAGTPADLLGAEGRAQIELEGLDEAALEALDAWVGEHGGRVLERRPGGRTLLELYREFSHGADDG